MWLSTLKSRIDKFNRAAVNHALEPIGVTVPRNIEAGHSLISFAYDQLDQAYDRALMGVSFSAAAWEKFEPTTQEMAEELFSRISDAYSTTLSKTDSTLISMLA